MPKNKWHPSNITHRQKLIRARDYNKFKEKSKHKLEKIDISKSDWSNMQIKLHKKGK